MATNDPAVRAELFCGDEEKIAEHQRQVMNADGSALRIIGKLMAFMAIVITPVLLLVLHQLGKIHIPFFP